MIFVNVRGQRNSYKKHDIMPKKLQQDRFLSEILKKKQALKV